MRPKPFVLIILDGWGYREETADNAISCATTPVWDELWRRCPHLLISGSGGDVGLPNGQMGNSEVGHMNLGAGRVVYQDFTRIEKAILDKSFAKKEAFHDLFAKLYANKKALHVLGLLSDGGVHSHEQHIFALLEAAARAGLEKIYVHAFLDGRDVPPKSAHASLQLLQDKLTELGVGQIASITGRYYAMDRDQRWDRVEAAYHAIALGQAPYHAASALLGLDHAYARGESDEFVKPTLLLDNYSGVAADDGIVFMNFRSDRARQLTRAFVDVEFKGFARDLIPLSGFVTLTQYAADIPAQVAFAPENLSPVLGEVFAEHHLTQLRIAETEKYAHVTFFINGGAEHPFPGETRILIPSPKVATYDLQPEMSAPEVTDKLVAAIQNQTFDVIICNYANPDMVGHTGNLPAAIKAIEVIDSCLGRIVQALEQVGGECLITADHGNVEQMFDHQTHQPHTAHTCDLVPFVYVGRDASVLQSQGILADVAPTLLYLMDLPIPSQMTGNILLKLK